MNVFHHVHPLLTGRHGCQLCPMDLIIGRPPGADRRVMAPGPAIRAVQARRRGHKATPFAVTVSRITAATAAAKASTGRTRLRRFPRPVYLMSPLLSLPLVQAAAASTRPRGPVPQCRPASSSVGHPSQKPFQQRSVTQVHIGRKLARLRRVGAAGHPSGDHQLALRQRRRCQLIRQAHDVVGGTV